MSPGFLQEAQTTITSVNGTSLDNPDAVGFIFADAVGFIFGMGIATILFGLLFGLAVYAINSLFLMKLFKKANVEGWIAWIPIYNMFKFLQLGGYSGWLILLALIPAVGTLAVAILMAMAAYEIGKKLGKDGAWVIMYIFLAIIWTGILGFDASKWSEGRGRPSIAPEKSPV